DVRSAALRVAAPDEDARRGRGDGGTGGGGVWRERRGDAGTRRRGERKEKSADQKGSGAIHSRPLSATGRGRFRRRKIQKVSRPVTNPPTCAQKAIPPAARGLAMASAPPKNCVRNQRPR